MSEIAVARPAPSTSNASGHSSTKQAPKLRDSCTRCATSKVKCSKDKPTCSRCARRGLQCEYAASQRSGRTSYSGPASTTATQPQQAVRSPPSPSSNHHKPMSSSPSSHHPSHGMQPPAPQPALMLPPTPSSSAAPTSLSLSPFGPEMDDLFASFTTLPLPNALAMDGAQHGAPPPRYRQDSSSSESGFGGFDIFSTSGQSSDLGTEQTEQSQDFLAGDLSCFKYSDPSDCSDCCLTNALELLRRLFPNASDACTLPGRNKANCKLPTIESVISENREMIDSIGTMLDCPCSLDEYVATIICLVVFKMIAWYAAAAREMPVPGMAMDWKNHSGPNPEPCLSHLEEVLQFPTVVGSYHIGGQNPNRMAATLVLSELHRVQRLVRRLSERFDSVKARNRASQDSHSDSGSGDERPSGKLSSGSLTPLSTSTLDLLESDIRKRLRLVSLENIETIRG